MLAAATSKLYALPLDRALSLAPADERFSASALTLWPDGQKLVAVPMIADGMRRLAAWEGRFLFSGRGGLRPLSADAVRHHMGPALGAVTRQRR